MDYEDFELEIRRASEGGFTAHVRSPAGETEDRIESPAEIEALLRTSGEDDRRSPVPQRHLAAGTSEPERPEGEAPSKKALGRALFDALFGGEVGVLFYDSLATVGADRGLRIKLRFDLADPRVADIASLPWELLYADRLGGYLALSRRTPVVRYVEVPRPSRPAPLPNVLRILVMISSPRGLPPLDLEAERRKIESSWAGLSGVEVTFLEEPTRERLGAVLRDAHRAGRPHHALHFMGHGRSVRQTGVGELLFVDGEGAPRPVAGEELARELADFPDLRFVFLNACETGAGPTGADATDPFAGVAAALVRTGISAVVAMRQPISDAAAIELSRVVYERIAAGDPIDTAITEGRLALDRLPEAAEEWGTPVLLFRLPDGRLFEPRARKALTGGRLAALGTAVLVVLALGLWTLAPLRPDDPCREDASEEAVALVESAVRNIQNGSDEHAEESLRHALDLEPHYARAHSTLGFLQMGRGHYGAARGSFSRAVETQPGCAAHHFNLGSFHLSRGELGAAETHLARALELDPDYTAASAALGRAYLLHGAPDAARRALEEGLHRAEEGDAPRDDETLYSLHANLGRVASARGRPDEAVEHLERARALLPPGDTRRAEVLADLAEAHASAGRTREACNELDTLLPLDRDPHGSGERKAVTLADRLHCARTIEHGR